MELLSRVATIGLMSGMVAGQGAFGQSALAPTACKGTVLSGKVLDSSMALVPGATVRLDDGLTETSGSDGGFRFGCVAVGAHHLTAVAEGFAIREVTVAMPHAEVEVVLQPQALTTEMDVDAEDGSAPSATQSGPSTTIKGDRLHSLADDPDDLLRQLQQMAAAGGGSPSSATITVDGFQDSSKLPPKDSIAYIKVNPDQFSAEYREPPFDGGRVEVYTKPGQKAYHGALFLTNGSPWMNAKDPFSTSKASLGKQRYGFELTGPVRLKGSDFAMNLEHRSIDNFAVVNAVTLDGAGNPVSVLANVATPQRLWIGTGRVDWQLGAKNTLIASYSANVNSLRNVGTGGTSLAETGYSSGQREHLLRLTDVTTASARLMHEARVELRWNGETDVPNSTATQVQVSGASTGGGSSIGRKDVREFKVEVDDDAILTTRNHTLKFGTQLRIYNDHQSLPTNFNGTYTFGGGTAPVLGAGGVPVAGQTTTITGLEQYRRALLHLPGGSPTAYSDVEGTPEVHFVQVQDALFFQDDWNVGHGVHVNMGLRYYLQNQPTVLNSMTPRMGVVWSPGKKGTWTVHAHAGLFSGQFGRNFAAEMQREDGVQRVTSTIYNPVYGSPFAGSTAIHSVRTLNPHLQNLTWAAENIGGTRSLPHGWNVSADFYLGRIWNYTRTLNVNSPLNNLPTGPRPSTPNLNVLEVQPSGQGRVNAEFFGLEQHASKRVQLSLGGVHIDLVDDTNDDEFSSPQSSRSNAGEFARRSGQGAWEVFGNATFKLPQKVELSGDFHAQGDSHYNITTGFDNNGDGNFNDRPQYALPGTPGAVSTRYGLLAASGGTAGVFGRNRGVLPWTFYLDTNLQRTFVMTQDAKNEHQQKLTLNLRSANLLNHTNVTTVGGVLGSPLFGVPYAADSGRRVEAGLRYSF